MSTDSESILGTTRAEIDQYLATGHPIIDYWLGRIDSDHGPERLKVTTADTIARTNALLGLFGITLANWPDMIRAFDDERSHPFDITSARALQRLGLGPGDVCLKIGYDRLPIESEEDGNTAFDLTFGSEGYEIVTKLHGDFWTERQFVDAETDVEFWEADATTEQKAQIEDGLDPIESLIEYVMTLEADISWRTNS